MDLKSETALATRTLGAPEQPAPAPAFTTPTFPSAHHQLAALVDYLVKSDEEAFMNLMKEGTPPPADSVALSRRMKTMLLGYREARLAAEKAPLHQMVKAAIEDIRGGKSEDALKRLAVVGMALDYVSHPAMSIAESRAAD